MGGREASRPLITHIYAILRRFTHFYVLLLVYTPSYLFWPAGQKVHYPSLGELPVFWPAGQKVHYSLRQSKGKRRVYAPGASGSLKVKDGYEDRPLAGGPGQTSCPGP